MCKIRFMILQSQLLTRLGSERFIGWIKVGRVSKKIFLHDFLSQSMSSVDLPSTVGDDAHIYNDEQDQEVEDGRPPTASGPVTRRESAASVTTPSSIGGRDGGTWVETYAYRASVKGEGKWKCGFCR